MTIPNSQFVYSQASGNTSTGVFLPIFESRDPTSYDTNYLVKQQWINTVSYALWILVGFTSTGGIVQAKWIRLNNTSPGNLSWVTISSNTVMDSNTGYICFSGSQLALNLPLSSNVGDLIEVTTRTSAGFMIQQGSGQQISEGTLSTTLGGSGSVTSLKVNDSLRMVCVEANVAWTVLSTVGNLTYT